MRILKYLGIVLGTIIGLILIVAIFVPTEFKYEKSIVINAPIDSIWVNVSSLSALDQWSPWNDHDPNMKKKLTGLDGAVGATQSWESDIVGSGSQTIVTVNKPNLFETDIKFYKPQKSHGKTYVHLTAQRSGIKTTWGMTGSMPYPLNILIVFMNMEKTMGKDWDNGLSKLKKMSENE